MLHMNGSGCFLKSFSEETSRKYLDDAIGDLNMAAALYFEAEELEDLNRKRRRRQQHL